MAVTIASGLSSSFSASTGRPCQGHLVYGVNNAKWYCFWISSTQTLNLSYSPTFASWTTSSTPLALANIHNNEGRDFAFANVSILGNDYVHMNSTYAVGTSSTKSYHARFKLDNGVNPNTGWTTTNSETQITTRSVSSSGIPSGASTIVDSTGKVSDGNSFLSSGSAMTDQRFAQFANADTAAAWTLTVPGAFPAAYTTTNYVTSMAFADLGSGNLLSVCDNASASGSMTNLEWSKWTTSWSTAATVTAGITSTSSNFWGMVARTPTEVHVVALSDNASTYVHRIFNGTSWANGASIPSVTPVTNGGIFLATNGTSVWMFVISAGNAIGYIVYSGGAWSGSWTNLVPSSSNQRSYLTGYPLVSAGAIGVIWTELVGATYSIVGTTLGMPQTFNLGVATETGTAVAVGHTVTGTAQKAIGVATATGSETAWSSAKGSGTATTSITVASETGTAPSIGRSVSGAATRSITVATETTSVPSVTGALGAVLRSLGQVSGTGSASNVSASGSGTLLKSIGVATETGTAPAQSRSVSGTATKSITVATETGSVVSVGRTVGTATRNLPVTSIAGSVINVGYVLGGEVTRALGVITETTSAVAVSRSVSGAAMSSLGVAHVSTSEIALPAHGTGGTSKSIAVATETTSVPPIIGLREGLAALGFITETGTATNVSAQGTGSAIRSVGVAHETTSVSTVAGDIGGSVSRTITVATSSVAAPGVSRSVSGEATRIISTATEVASLATLVGSVLDTTRAIGVARSNGSAASVGHQIASMFATIGVANVVASGVSPHGVLDTALFQVLPGLTDLIN